MEVQTNIYQVNDIVPDLKDTINELSKDFTLLSDLLGVEDYYESLDTENYILDLEDFPVSKSLSKEILSKIDKFTTGIFDKHIKVKYSDQEDILLKLAKVHNLLSEQLQYSSNEHDGFTTIENNCTVWLVVARINGFIYGATCVFYNPDLSPNILIQGISRSFIPSLLEILKPGILETLPRLNSLLLPVVESIARSMKAPKIYVVPVGKQGDILEKHYGFILDKDIIFPCSMIRGSDMIKNNARNFKIYSKTLSYRINEE